MKKIFCLLFFLIALSSCVKEELVDTDVVKSIVFEGHDSDYIEEYYYNEEGRLINHNNSTYHYDEKGNISTIVDDTNSSITLVYRYDQLNRLIQVIQNYGNSSWNQSLITYEKDYVKVVLEDYITLLYYNSEGQVVKRINYYEKDGEKKLNSTPYINIWDSNGNLIRKEFYRDVTSGIDDIWTFPSSISYIMEFEYDLDKKNVFEFNRTLSGRTGVYDLANVIAISNIPYGFTYDHWFSKNQVISNPFIELDVVRVFSYDELGRIVEINYYSDVGVENQESDLRYKYKIEYFN